MNLGWAELLILALCVLILLALATFVVVVGVKLVTVLNLLIERLGHAPVDRMGGRGDNVDDRPEPPR